MSLKLASCTDDSDKSTMRACNMFGECYYLLMDKRIAERAKHLAAQLRVESAGANAFDIAYGLNKTFGHKGQDALDFEAEFVKHWIGCVGVAP